MIYNNLLFFHIPKAGGSSIEKMFLPNHKKLEFVIRIIFKESRFSHWIVGTMRNRNWRLFIFWLVSIFMCDMKNLWGIHKGKVLHHLTYLDIYKKKKLYLKHTNTSLTDFTKWCIVRNPYDRIISAYHFIGNNLTFTQFVYWVYGELDKYYRYKIDPFVVILPQWEFIINENGKNGMDEILHFENLKSEFKDFQKKYNLQHLSLPHINSRKRLNKNIKTYYTQELADMVYHMYRWDYKMFGYKRIQLRGGNLVGELRSPITLGERSSPITPSSLDGGGNLGSPQAPSSLDGGENPVGELRPLITPSSLDGGENPVEELRPPITLGGRSSPTHKY